VYLIDPALLSTTASRQSKIISMPRPSIIRFCALLAVLGLIAGSLTLSAQSNSNRRGRKYKAPPPAARIEVTILKADSGKPITNAHVIFHPIEGDKDKGYLELKTDQDGKAVIDILPIGDTVRLQVIATGFQTYGADYQVNEPKLAWEVCLRRPGAQYSIYTNHPTSLGASTCPANISHQNSGKDSGSAATGEKPSGSPNQSQPGEGQSMPQPN
jgi:hypothetical protein